MGSKGRRCHDDSQRSCDPQPSTKGSRQHAASKCVRAAPPRPAVLRPIDTSPAGGSCRWAARVLKPGGALHVTCSTPPVFTHSR